MHVFLELGKALVRLRDIVGVVPLGEVVQRVYCTHCVLLRGARSLPVTQTQYDALVARLRNLGNCCVVTIKPE